MAFKHGSNKIFDTAKGRRPSMPNAFCPSCQEEIYIEGVPDLGQRVSCENCDLEIEVIWLYPFTLDYPEDSVYYQSLIHDMGE
jgi:lysine biosynthesis protein LysW